MVNTLSKGLTRELETVSLRYLSKENLPIAFNYLPIAFN